MKDRFRLEKLEKRVKAERADPRNYRGNHYIPSPEEVRLLNAKDRIARKDEALNHRRNLRAEAFDEVRSETATDSHITEVKRQEEDFERRATFNLFGWAVLAFVALAILGQCAK